MSGLAFSFLNRAAIGSATIAASTTFLEAGNPATAVQDATRPFLRAYSLDLSAQILTLDFGAAVALEAIALIHANFTAATIRGHASDTWGSPSYTSGALTIGKTENNRRYHHAHRPTVAVPFNYRYLSLSIPNQATTDGLNRFALGGIWAGLLTEAPHDLLLGADERKVEPHHNVDTPDGRRLQRLKMDDAYCQIAARRMAYDNATLAAWRVLDDAWSAAPGRAALVLLSSFAPAESYVMVQESESAWPHAGLGSVGALELRELIAGT